MSSSNNSQQQNSRPPMNGQAFSAFEFCDRMKYEFEFVNSQLNMYKIENERLRSEKEELIQQSKKFFEMSYYLNTNNHIVSEVNDRLSSMMQRVLNELPEDKRKMYQQELNNVNNVTTADVQHRIKSKSQNKPSSSSSSSLSEQQATREQQTLEKPKELTLLTTIPVDSSASSVTLSRDACRVFVGGKGKVEVVSTISDRKLKESIDFSPLQYVRSCKLFRDESTLVVSGEGSGIHLFDLSRGMKKLTLSTLDSNVNYSLSLSGDDSTVFATLLKGTIGMWDLRSSQLVRLFDGHKSPCSSIDIDPSGKVLMSGGLDKAVKMWDINSGKCFQEFQTPSRVLSLSNSSSSDLIVYGLEDGGLDLTTYKTQSNTLSVTKHSDCVLTTKFSPKGNYIVSGAKGGMLTISNVDSSFREVASERMSNSVLSCDIVSGNDGDYISVGTWDNKVTMYKLSSVQ